MKDWIVANIANPDFTVSDFKDIADMSLNNTQMLKREDYLKSEFIKTNPLFLNDRGEFSKDKFNEFYDLKLLDFQLFQTEEIPEELDMFDINRTKDTKVRDNGFFLGLHENPDRLKVGIEGINVWSAPEKTKSELAQAEKVWDSEKLEYKDYSPNDKALFGSKYGIVKWIDSLFDEPLVLALYEEEGTHINPITGLEVKHRKGDYKLNDNGTYYYETLGDRSPIGKLVLSFMDTLTVDGTSINKYDFFDSDDIEKSVPGVIFKTAASLVPLFLGPEVAALYSAALIAREMSKSLPMLSGMLTAFSDGDTPKWMNTVAALGEKFSSGTSDYAKNNAFSFENFGNLAADVALQWGQQKSIVSVFNKLKGSKNYVKEATEKAQALYAAKRPTMTGVSDEALMNACLKKFVPQAEKAAMLAGLLGRDASLVYMAIVSNSDVYNSMIENGATKKEAAAVALGSTLGMFAVDKYLGLGEVFFDDATENSVKLARQSIKNEILGYTDDQGVKHLGIREAFNQIKSSDKSLANKLLGYIKLASDKSKETVNSFADDLKYHSTGLIGKAVGEGLEEVSEELVTDVFKSMYEVAGVLGADTSVKDVGAWDNALERYSMSFFGGALGGGIFYGKELVTGERPFKTDKTVSEMATLIRNNQTLALRDEVEKRRKKGKLGSTKLSYKTEGANGELVYLTAKDESESQNEAIAKALNLKITALEAVINNNQLGLSDDEAFKQMVLAEDRFNRYLGISHITDYYLDLNNVIEKVSLAYLNLENAKKTINGDPNGDILVGDRRRTSELEQEYQLNILKYLDEYNKAIEERNLFLSGDSSLDYTRKLAFAMDPTLHKPFLPIDEEQIWKKTFGDKTRDLVSEDEKANFIINILPNEYRESLKTNLTVSWDRYKQFEKTVAPELAGVANLVPQFKQSTLRFLNLLNTWNLDSEKLKKSYLNFDSKLDTESDEEYLTRNTKRIDPVTGVEESLDEFINRHNNRIREIERLNEEKDREFVDKILLELLAVNGMVDPIISRALKNVIIPLRAKAIILRKIKLLGLHPDEEEILNKLDINLSNTNLIIDTVKKAEVNRALAKVLQILNDLANYNVLYLDGTSAIGINTIYEGEEDTPTLDDIITDSDLWLQDINDESKEYIKNKVAELKNYIGGDANLSTAIELKSTIDFNQESALIGELLGAYDYFNALLKLLIDPVLNTIQSLFLSISNNPIFNLHLNIKQTIKNPVIELVKLLGGKILNGNEVPEVEAILEKILDKFENIEDINELLLDDVLLKALYTTRDLLQLIGTYVYAASSNSDIDHPIGHNKVMNEFARKHKDVVVNWEELPEIDSDYAAVYTRLLGEYWRDIQFWIELSNKNAVNKKAQFERIDKAFTDSLLNLIINNLDKFKVTFDDKEYNLLSGISDISLNDNGTSLFNIEKLLYNNFLNALKDSGLTVELFLSKSKLLENLIPSLANIKNLKIAELSDKLTDKLFTEYDRLNYFAMILTLNPVTFYSLLKGRVSQNANIAPITVLEYASKLAVASTNDLFRDIINYAFKQSGDRRYFAKNTTIIPGVAGAGKTLVVGRAIKDSTDGNILAVGPTNTQALSLLKSLGLQSSTTIDKLLKDLLGELLYSEIKLDIEKVVWVDNKVKELPKFFEAWVDNGLGLVKLREDIDIKFNSLPNVPKVIMIDEATHLNTVFALILDKYMQLVGGLLVLLGDSNQRGHVKNAIGNIRESDLFTIRAPKLRTSLRDNNIQKQANLLVVNSLLDLILDKVENLSEEDLAAYWTNVSKLISKLNFKVYNKDEINGDLLTLSITPDIIAKINKPDKTIGFIGSTNSPAYTALQNAGLADKVEVLSMDQMQGLEFDYVIIDQLFEAPGDNIGIRDFMLDLYTLMSRGRSASIFIDNGLSSIIGNNIYQEYTAKAPSLVDKINGTSAVDELRARKLRMLDLMDLSQPKSATSSDPAPLVNPETDFKNPDEAEVDTIAKLLILAAYKLDSEKERIGESKTDDYIQSLFTIPSYSDVTYTGVTIGNEETRKGKDEKEYKNNTWRIERPNEGPLRNLLAILNDKEEAFWYNDKKKWQDLLYAVKSAIIFNHNWNETKLGTTSKILPAAILNNFNLKDWEEGTYELEIRSVEGEAQPLFAPMKEIGFEYNGKRYIADIVFKVKNKQGRECIFDLAGINNPDTLFKNLPKIKENIQDRLLNLKNLSEDERKRLENILSTIDVQAAKYKNLFDSWINNFDKEGKFSLNISGAIKHTKTTWFVERAGQPIRLGGWINPNTGEPDHTNLKLMNPGMVFSNIYTYASKEITEIDLSLRGKAVIFVSSDTLLKPEELIGRYINLKKDPEHNSPVVRMIVLDNYGLSLELLYDPKFIKAFQNGNEERSPLRLNFLGILMYTSMWNFRAGLIQFNAALNNWKTKNNYSDDKVDAIIRAQLYLYDNKKLSEQARNTYLAGLGLTIEDINNLEKFNLEDCKNIPMFRLRYAKKEDNGFHIEEFNVQGSTAYDGKSKVNLIALTPQKALLFQELVNRVLKAIVQSDNRESLGLLMLKEDGKTPWNEDEFIDIKQASHKRTLSNIVKLDENKLLVITFDGKLIAYPNGWEWSSIPTLISSIIRTVTYFQYNPDLLSDSSMESATIWIYDKTTNGKEEKRPFKTLIGTLFSDGILKTKDNTTLPEKEHPDRSLVDMFALMFHGTTLDVHMTDTPKHPNPKAEDARFKNGFLVTPDISRRKSSAGDSDIVQFESLGIKFYEIETNDALFRCNVDLRPAGISLDINMLEKSNLELPELLIEPEPLEEESFETKFPNATFLITLVNQEGESLDYNEESISEAIDYYNKLNIPNVIALIEDDGEEALDYPTYYYREGNSDVKIGTLREYLTSLTTESVTDIKVDKGEIIVKTDSNTYQLNKNTYKLELQKKESPKATRFSLKVELDGKQVSVESAILNLLNNKDFIEEFGEDIVQLFATDLNNIINQSKTTSDDIIQLQIKELLKNNEDYDDILNELEDNYNDLYNKIFEC